jgi:hypothetical protein
MLLKKICKVNKGSFKEKKQSISLIIIKGFIKKDIFFVFLIKRDGVLLKKKKGTEKIF